MGPSRLAEELGKGIGVADAHVQYALESLEMATLR